MLTSFERVLYVHRQSYNSNKKRKNINHEILTTSYKISVHYLAFKIIKVIITKANEPLNKDLK